MIAALVLAAGSARRMGRQKLLLPAGGKPLLRWTVEAVAATAADPVLVVVGSEGPAIREALRGLRAGFVDNPRHAEGMATSLRAGVEALPAEAEGALVVLGDQPIPAAVIERILRARRASGAAIVAPSYRGRRGNPVLFARSLFPELRRLEGDRGARGVVDRRPGDLLLVPFPHLPPPDIDTPADLAAHGPSLARGVQRPPGSEDEPRDGRTDDR